MADKPGYRLQRPERACFNCEYCQMMPLVGYYCEKYEDGVTGIAICDSWEKQVTKRKQYIAGPFITKTEEER